MKYMIMSLVLIGSIGAQAKTCYSASSNVPSAIPKELCFESLKLSEAGTHVITNGADNNFPSTLKTSGVYVNNGNYIFTADANIVELSMGSCEEHYSAKLTINGAADLHTGEIIADNLNMVVDYTYTTDICHSRAQDHSIQYKKSQ